MESFALFFRSGNPPIKIDLLNFVRIYLLRNYFEKILKRILFSRFSSDLATSVKRQARARLISTEAFLNLKKKFWNPENKR